PAENIEFASRPDVERVPERHLRDNDGIGPGQAAVPAQAEVAIREDVLGVAPGLVNGAASGTRGIIDGHPLFIAADCRALSLPDGTTVGRAPQVATQRVLQEAKIVKSSVWIASQDRVTAEYVGFEDAPKGPCHSGIRGETVSRLAKVIGDVIK